MEIGAFFNIVSSVLGFNVLKRKDFKHWNGFFSSIYLISTQDLRSAKH
jgi:hypothetical protein